MFFFMCNDCKGRFIAEASVEPSDGTGVPSNHIFVVEKTRWVIDVTL